MILNEMVIYLLMVWEHVHHDFEMIFASIMRIRRKFSVMQIRYGGCKGTVSVNPDLDYTEKQLILRKSMHKFISNT